MGANNEVQGLRRLYSWPQKWGKMRLRDCVDSYNRLTKEMGKRRLTDIDVKKNSLPICVYNKTNIDSTADHRNGGRTRLRDCVKWLPRRQRRECCPLNPLAAGHLSHMCVLWARFLVIFSYIKFLCVPDSALLCIRRDISDKSCCLHGIFFMGTDLKLWNIIT